MRIMTGIGCLEIVFSRSNLVALLEAIDDDRGYPDELVPSVLWREGIEREHWHPKALLDGQPLRLQVTVEADEGHPDVPFVIQTYGELMAELGIEPIEQDAS